MGRSLKAQMRGLAKSSFAACMEWSRAGRVVAARRGLRDKPLVVGYHRVVQDFSVSKCQSISPMLTSARTFEQHLDWIGSHYRFVSLDELELTLDGSTTNATAHSKPVAAVTFDDGYMDVYENAFPILKRKGIPFATFVVTDLVGTSKLQVHDELYLLLSVILEQENGSTVDYWSNVVARLGLPAERASHLSGQLNGLTDAFQATRLLLETLGRTGIHEFVRALRSQVALHEDQLREFRSLDWDMLKEMQAGGGTVGSHTRSHVMLADESAAVVRDQVEGSRRELQLRLGTPIKHFAYPDGRFDADAIQAVAQAGYHTAYTICGHQDTAQPLLTISRRMLWEKACTNVFGRFSPAILSCQVNGIFDPADKCRLHH